MLLLKIERCNCNSLLKNPENSNEKVNGIISGLCINTDKIEENDIFNFNTENNVEKKKINVNEI